MAKFDINPQEILWGDNVEKEGGEIAFMKGEEQEEETKVRVFGRLEREGHQRVEEIDHGTCPALWWGWGGHLEEADHQGLHPPHEGEHCLALWKNSHLSRRHLGGGCGLKADLVLSECTLNVTVA